MNRKDRRAQFEAQKPEHRLGDAPIEERAHSKLTAVMAALDNFVNEGAKKGEREWGLVVMMFPYGNVDGRCNYISNGANRKDIVTLMKEMIARFEGMPEVQGRA